MSGRDANAGRPVRKSAAETRAQDGRAGSGGALHPRTLRVVSGQGLWPASEQPKAAERARASLEACGDAIAPRTVHQTGPTQGHPGVAVIKLGRRLLSFTKRRPQRPPGRPVELMNYPLPTLRVTGSGAIARWASLFLPRDRPQRARRFEHN